MKTPPWSGRVQRYDAVDSTNERALAALAAGTGTHGDVFVARAQTEGRGTRGRPWSSAPGGLYVSAIVRTDVAPPAGLWTAAGALAVHDLCAQVGVAAALDWPNDVVVGPGKAKLAGILAESRGTPLAYAIGMGVNVDRGVVDPAVERERATASLVSSGATVDARRASEHLLEALERRVAEAVDDAARLFDAFFERCLLRGQPVQIEQGSRAVRGTFVGLDPERGVLLAGAAAELVAVPLGHVSSMRAAPLAAPGDDPGAPPP